MKSFLFFVLVALSTSAFAFKDCTVDLDSGASFSALISDSGNNRAMVRSLDTGLTANCVVTGNEYICSGNRGERIEITMNLSRVSIIDMDGSIERGQISCEDSNK